MESIHSIQNEIVTTNELIINKSRFLSFAKHIESTQDADSFLSEITKKFKDARHICYAYRLTNTSKASDNGEPSGTAGKPILQVIEKQNLYNIIVIVVRYFGGIKLGAGGLLRAYTNATTQCLEKATKIDWYPSTLYSIQFDYKEYQPFLNSIKDRAVQVVSTNFDNGAKIEFIARNDEIFTDATKIKDLMYCFPIK